MVERIRDPTPEEIKRACAEIQSKWTDQERRSRIGYRWNQSRRYVPGIREYPTTVFVVKPLP